MTLWGEPDLLYVQSFEQLHAGIRNCVTVQITHKYRLVQQTLQVMEMALMDDSTLVIFSFTCATCSLHRTVLRRDCFNSQVIFELTHDRCKACKIRAGITYSTKYEKIELLI